MTTLEKLVEPFVICLGVLAIGLIVYEDKKYWKKDSDYLKRKDYVEEIRGEGL